MRSRYTAYTLANLDYIRDTMRERALAGFNENEALARRWAKRVVWIKLAVKQTAIESATRGHVEFEAFYVENGRLQSIHENSRFTCVDKRWYYTDGKQLPPTHSRQRISRTMDCPCGSLRKYKNCHERVR